MSCDASCSLRRATSPIESGGMTPESPEPSATAKSKGGVGTCEVGDFDLAFPFPLFDDYTWSLA